MLERPRGDGDAYSNASVVGVAYLAPDGSWGDLPALVGLGQSVELGVVLALTSGQPAPDPSSVMVQITGPAGDVTSWVAAERESLSETRELYRLAPAGAHQGWVPGEVGTYDVLAQVSITDGNPEDNHWAGGTCVTAASHLELPVQVVQ